MASGAFQETVEVGETTIKFKKLTFDFKLEKGQEYVLLERQEGGLYDWSGNVLDLSEIYEVKVSGRVRIKVGLSDKGWENLYFDVTEICVNGDKDKFKGKGVDVYNPMYEGLIDKEIDFESKHIIEIWYKDLEVQQKLWDEMDKMDKNGEWCSFYNCNLCGEEIETIRYHCKICDEDNFDMCKACYTEKKHEHDMEKIEIEIEILSENNEEVLNYIRKETKKKIEVETELKPDNI